LNQKDGPLVGSEGHTDISSNAKKFVRANH